MTQAAMKNIVETAETDGRFTSFVAAVKAADLNDTLSDPNSTFTVFAPTDDAFKNLPDGTMDTLFKDPQGDLLQILLYHVVNEKLMSVDLEKLTSTETLQGGALIISVSNGTVRVDGATVIITDIECSNGVIHGVDTVMLPPA
jgi:transforming growth factor-beta-induced protein